MISVKRSLFDVAELLVFRRQATRVDSEKGRRLRAAVMLEDRDTQLAGLVGKVLLDPGAGEDQHPDRQDVQHRVVALERGRAAVLRPVGPEGDLRHLTVIGPAGRDKLRALG